jgi:hypothetical protein
MRQFDVPGSGSRMAQQRHVTTADVLAESFVRTSRQFIVKVAAQHFALTSARARTASRTG